MKISPINLHKATILTINGKHRSQQLLEEITTSNSPNLTQVSIFNSHFDLTTFSSLPSAIQTLVIRNSVIINHIEGFIAGSNLKVIELPFCNLSAIPRIYSTALQKLNVSHNQIRRLDYIPNEQNLKVLDIRNNRLQAITKRAFYQENLTILHQFLANISSKQSHQLVQPDNQGMIAIEALLPHMLVSWKSQKWVEVCEQIVQNDNDSLMTQIVPYLDQEFLNIIFDLAKKSKKHKILELLIKSLNVDNLSLHDKVMLLIPSLLPYSVLRTVPLQLLVQSISQSSRQNKKIVVFLQHIKHECEQRNIFIQFQRDLINFMSLSIKYRHAYEAQFLMTQIAFFEDYDFSNSAIRKYLLHLENLTLLKALLQKSKFKQWVFGSVQEVKYQRKLSKMIHRAKKQYMNQECASNGTWYFPEYRERKTFCLKNDVYDYQILKEYEEMQCSYLQKDLRYTIKFYNKGNQISLSKKVESVLKKKSLIGLNNKSRVTSICLSSSIV